MYANTEEGNRVGAQEKFVYYLCVKSQSIWYTDFKHIFYLYWKRLTFTTNEYQRYTKKTVQIKIKYIIPIDVRTHIL